MSQRFAIDTDYTVEVTTETLRAVIECVDRAVGRNWNKHRSPYSAPAPRWRLDTPETLEVAAREISWTGSSRFFRFDFSPTCPRQAELLLTGWDQLGVAVYVDRQCLCGVEGDTEIERMQAAIRAKRVAEGTWIEHSYPAPDDEDPEFDAWCARIGELEDTPESGWRNAECLLYMWEQLKKVLPLDNSDVDQAIIDRALTKPPEIIDPELVIPVSPTESLRSD